MNPLGVCIVKSKFCRLIFWDLNCQKSERGGEVSPKAEIVWVFLYTRASLNTYLGQVFALVLHIGIATDILSKFAAVTIALLVIDCNWLESSI